MFELWQLQLGAVALIAAVGIILFLRYPEVKKYIPLIKWAARVLRITVDHWKARKVYVDSTIIIERYTALLDMYSFSQSAAVSRAWFSKFIVDTYDRVFDESGNKEDARRISNAFYSLIVNHKDIVETLRSLDEIKTIDVKRTTIIFIDFLGEFFTLSLRTDRLFYEMIIVGINKALLQIKNGGLDKKTLSKVSGTVWRMYQLTRAYKKLDGNKGLTETEFEKKMQDALSTLLSYFN